MDKDALEQRIWETFKGGGPFAHNLIGMDLNKLSKIDKEAADALYEELIEEGY